MTVKLDLVTGFLGAGKTTFIRYYIRWLRQLGIKHVIVENEFGIANVDSAILRGDGADVAELSGGCACCGQKANFLKLLRSLCRESGIERVVVEPSGVFNPHDFFDAVLDPDIASHAVPGAMLAIVDPVAFVDLDESSREILREQMLCSGQVLLSKTGKMSREEAEGRARALADMFPGEALPPVETRAWKDFSPDDFARLSTALPSATERARRFWEHKAIFDGALVIGADVFSEQDVEALLDVLADGGYGRVLRIKGHLRAEGGGFLQINCTAETRSIERVDYPTKPLVNFIGQGLQREAIQALFRKRSV